LWVQSGVRRLVSCRDCEGLQAVPGGKEQRCRAERRVPLTSWVVPCASRSVMKTKGPKFREACSQPATVTVRPVSDARRLPQSCVRCTRDGTTVSGAAAAALLLLLLSSRWLPALIGIPTRARAAAGGRVSRSPALTNPTRRVARRSDSINIASKLNGNPRIHTRLRCMQLRGAGSIFW
jgi:hypothetical protein